MIRYFIVEDHALSRDFLRALCKRSSKLRWIGEACDFKQGLARISELRPDLVLLDLDLPDGDGLDIAAVIAKSDPHCRFAVISGHCDSYAVVRSMQLGCIAFIHKAIEGLEQMREIIPILASGGTFVSKTFIKLRESILNDPRAWHKLLSERECDVLRLIGRALSNLEIAEQLQITEATVQTHRSLIMRKLGVGGTPKLIRFAQENGFNREWAPLSVAAIRKDSSKMAS